MRDQPLVERLDIGIKQGDLRFKGFSCLFAGFNNAAEVPMFEGVGLIIDGGHPDFHLLPTGRAICARSGQRIGAPTHPITIFPLCAIGVTGLKGKNAPHFEMGIDRGQQPILICTSEHMLEGVAGHQHQPKALPQLQLATVTLVPGNRQIAGQCAGAG